MIPDVRLSELKAFQNDFLQWLMDMAQGVERTPKALCARILIVIFSATHSTSMVRLSALASYRRAQNVVCIFTFW